MADAFTISDPRVTESERNDDRERIGEICSANGKVREKGLGDLILSECGS